MQIRTLMITVLAVCVFPGCGGVKRPDGFPVLFPCEITITQGGKPLEGADVRLMPESGASPWVTSGKTDVNGVAKISTQANYSGAPEGTFKVLVSKTSVTPSKAGPEPEDVHSPEWQKWREVVTNEFCPLIRHIKPEFDDPKTTPHSITIAKGKNQKTFDVGDPVEITVQ